MAARRIEDVLLGEINNLRLENLNLNNEKPHLEPLVESEVKHAENIIYTSVAIEEYIEKIFCDAAQPPDGFG